MDIINGFSKLSREEKLQLLMQKFPHTHNRLDILQRFIEPKEDISEIIEKLSENYISNYILPFSVAPNFLIDDRMYFVPMVTEESSVVAAASYAAKFWAVHGGFRTWVTGTKKTGHIFFTWTGKADKIERAFPEIKEELVNAVAYHMSNMIKRGGGIYAIKLVRANNTVADYYEIMVEFETIDAMGANFINSALELMSSKLLTYISEHFADDEGRADIVMSILSNYNPECLVECEVSCKIDEFLPVSAHMSPGRFAEKFAQAVLISHQNTSRAVTNNKGIYNGMDAVLIATANDFRAAEACGHAYAAKDGMYRGLTNVFIEQNEFTFRLTVPLPLGTVGGVTSIHPMAGLALEILGNPSATDLMRIVAATGLASNFAAIRTLITEGIQKGHMKLHLNNILNLCKAEGFEKEKVENYFESHPVSFRAVTDYLTSLRNNK